MKHCDRCGKIITGKYYHFDDDDVEVDLCNDDCLISWLKVGRLTEKKIEIKYPCIMIDNRYKRLVYFTEACKGTIIKTDNVYKIGYHSTQWDMSCFTPYEITI